MTVEITVRGAVQGIGYRPFVASMAEQLHMRGTVRNSGGIVRIVVTDSRERISDFEKRLRNEVPPGGMVVSVTERVLNAPGADSSEVIDDSESSENASSGSSVSCVSETDGLNQKKAHGGAAFKIIESSGEVTDEIPAFPPDIGICPDCMGEMLDPSNRRYRYGLTSCASCGPRWSILEKLPYDRDTTTMKMFPMCPSCSAEYRKGRRRHAQTISCHDCGPQMVLLVPRGKEGSLRQFANDSDINFSKPDDREKIWNCLKKERGFQKAVSILQNGGILALKGVGGYQLLCSPYNGRSVARLRAMKGREAKPFAVMFPSMEAIEEYAVASGRERELLESSARPIVLLRRKFDGSDRSFASNVSGESRYLGAFLPSVGIQKLILDETGPLIVTSANLSGEPIPIDDEAFRDMIFAGGDRPNGIYTHGRKILRPLDDSVLAVVNGHTQFIRRSRGYVPMPVFLQELSEEGKEDRDKRCLFSNQFGNRKENHFSDETDESGNRGNRRTILAAGADLKSAFAIARGDRVVLSQYLGDLSDYEVTRNYQRLVPDMADVLLRAPGTGGHNHSQKVRHNSGWIDESKGCDLRELLVDHRTAAGESPDSGFDEVVCDLHPGYFSTRYAEQYAEEHGIPCLHVQHHQAHAASVMAEHGLRSCLGIVFDGTGAGTDGQLWGGEFLYLHGTDFERFGSLSPVKLQGGDAVSINADLAADCFLHAVGRDDLLTNPLTGKLLDQNFNTIVSTSMGRLFDAVSAMLGICHENGYEGECAILLENAAWDGLTRNQPEALLRYFEQLTKTADDGRMLLDCESILKGLLAMQADGLPRDIMALAFHLAIAEGAAEIAEELSQQTGEKKVCLSGGTFANRMLLTGLEDRLKKRGLRVYVNEQVPCNDGGIALGQAYLGLMQEAQNCV